MELLRLDARTLWASVTDVHCASLLGTDSPARECSSTSTDWMVRKGYLSPSDAKSSLWQRQFQNLLKPDLQLLRSNHRGCQPVCVHEFIPSTLHRPLHGWFDVDQVAVNPDGTPINNIESNDRGVRPTAWQPSPTQPFGIVAILWVLDESGEILVGPEECGHVKHPSIAVGQGVWAGGEIGFRNGKLRTVSLKTGHYLGQNEGGYEYKEDTLRPFVLKVFKEYDEVFLNGGGLIDFEVNVY